MAAEKHTDTGIAHDAIGALTKLSNDIAARDAEIERLNARLATARDLLREWKTADGYTHDWDGFEQRVDELLAE